MIVVEFVVKIIVVNRLNVSEVQNVLLQGYMGFDDITSQPHHKVTKKI